MQNVPRPLWLQQCKLLSILNTHTAIQIKLLTSYPKNEGGFWRERESIRKLVHFFLSFSFLIVKPTLQNTKTKTEYYRIIVSLETKTLTTHRQLISGKFAKFSPDNFWSKGGNPCSVRNFRPCKRACLPYSIFPFVAKKILP